VCGDAFLFLLKKATLFGSDEWYTTFTSHTLLLTKHLLYEKSNDPFTVRGLRWRYFRANSQRLGYAGRHPEF
jgi:hypothetical protein